MPRYQAYCSAAEIGLLTSYLDPQATAHLSWCGIRAKHVKMSHTMAFQITLRFPGSTPPSPIYHPPPPLTPPLQVTAVVQHTG